MLFGIFDLICYLSLRELECYQLPKNRSTVIYALRIKVFTNPKSLNSAKFNKSKILDQYQQKIKLILIQ
jgi:hypothetical protein